MYLNDDDCHPRMLIDVLLLSLLHLRSSSKLLDAQTRCFCEDFAAFGTMKTSWHCFHFCAWYLMSVFQFVTNYMYMQEISDKFFSICDKFFWLMKNLWHISLIVEKFVTNYFYCWKICDKFSAICDKFVSNFWQIISEFSKLFMTFEKLFATCDKSFIWHISGSTVKTLVSGRRS